MKPLLLCLFSACALAVTSSAHVLDQYLQVAQIALAPEGVRVELRLIPGAQVAARVFELIDTDGDGRLSRAEQQAYAQRVKQDLSLTVNQQTVLMTLVEAMFPERSAMDEGIGAIRLTFTTPAGLGGLGHRQLAFRNDHLPEFSAYLVNPLIPESAAIKIAGLQRDVLQRELQVDFQTTATATRNGWLGWSALLCGLFLALLFGFHQCRQRNRGKRMRDLVRQMLPLPFCFCLLGIMASAVLAHEQPTTLVVMDVAPAQVTMDLHVPLTELESAFGNEVSVNPEATLPSWQAQFKQYLLDHIRPVSRDGQLWAVTVTDLQLQQAEQLQSGKFQEILVRLLLTPPAASNTRSFTLHYDLILHQVVTHKALVSIRSDWERGQNDETQVGVIRVDTATSKIEPFEISLAGGSWRAGFIGMIRHGIQHIREGTDHLLFLLVLLLPATLLVKAKRWGGFGGSRYSLMRLLKIVTAFTAGHSLTLLIGALGWFRLPQQPVEVLIAFSILVSAVHALRPLFPGKEIYVAAGFGLVHGLAFATVLSGLQLNAGPMALSILGFNLGIELMQLFVIAVTIPWLVLLSLTPVYRSVRIVCAVLAAIAALGWMVSRITGTENFIDRAMQTATAYAPLGILFLALPALLAYLFYANRPNAAAHELMK